MKKRAKTERIRFTEGWLAALEIPKARKKVYDLKVQSLGLRIFPTGKKSFFWYRTGGANARRWENIGTCPAISLEKARAAALGFDTDHANWKLGGSRADQDPFTEKLSARGEPTLNDIWDDYISRHIQPHAKNATKAEADLRYAFRKHLTPWKDFKLSMISHERVSDLHLRIGQTHKAAANRLIEDLRAAIGFAISQKRWKGTNPCSGITFFNREPRNRFVQPNEMPALFSSLRLEPNKDVVDFVLLALCSGARKSDILSMRWSDVSIDSSRWLVPFPKNSKSYNVVLSPEVVAILKRRLSRRKDNSLWVFPAASRSGHATDFKKRWKALVERAGLSNLRQHDLRRTFGSWLAGGGTSLAIIGEALGHKSQAATRVYAHVNSDAVCGPVNAIVRTMFAAGRKKPKQLTAGN